MPGVYFKHRAGEVSEKGEGVHRILHIPRQCVKVPEAILFTFGFVWKFSSSKVKEK